MTDDQPGFIDSTLSRLDSQLHNGNYTPDWIAWTICALIAATGIGCIFAVTWILYTTGAL